MRVEGDEVTLRQVLDAFAPAGTWEYDLPVDAVVAGDAVILRVGGEALVAVPAKVLTQGETRELIGLVADAADEGIACSETRPHGPHRWLIATGAQLSAWGRCAGVPG